MEILRNGYRSSSLKHVFDKLFQYAANPNNRMYSGDVEIAANVLLKILQHLEKYPSLSDGRSSIAFVVRPDNFVVSAIVCLTLLMDSCSLFSLQDIIYLLDQLLTAISNATSEEKGVCMRNLILSLINLSF